VGVLNLREIQGHINSKKLKSNEKINIELLKKLQLIKKKFNKVKILGNGEIKDKISLEVNFLSNTAKKKLEKSGSSVKILSK
jgi:large subunit ribosomal protein L15